MRACARICASLTPLRPIACCPTKNSSVAVVHAMRGVLANPSAAQPPWGRASVLTNDFLVQYLSVNTCLGGGGELWYIERIKGEIKEVSGARSQGVALGDACNKFSPTATSSVAEMAVQRDCGHSSAPKNGGLRMTRHRLAPETRHLKPVLRCEATWKRKLRHWQT
jgi:hypothetical protein